MDNRVLDNPPKRNDEHPLEDYNVLDGVDHNYNNKNLWIPVYNSDAALV